MITIKVEEPVPYTDFLCCAQAVIDRQELQGAKFDISKQVVMKLQKEVDKNVENKMKELGIRLGEDGLRLDDSK